MILAPSQLNPLEQCSDHFPGQGGRWVSIRMLQWLDGARLPPPPPLVPSMNSKLNQLGLFQYMLLLSTSNLSLNSTGAFGVTRGLYSKRIYGNNFDRVVISQSVCSYQLLPPQSSICSQDWILPEQSPLRDLTIMVGSQTCHQMPRRKSY